MTNKLIYILAFSATLFSIATYYVISSYTDKSDSSSVIGLLSIDLVLMLSLAVLLIRKIFRVWIRARGYNTGSRLQKRIILLFSLVATIPTIMVAIFSTYFFNFGLQNWFDNKVVNVLNRSVVVGESYVKEHKVTMRAATLAVAEDLNDMYYDLVHSPGLFQKVINAQAEMRSLNEAIVFQKNTSTILAQTSLSFSLTFSSIAIEDLKKADKGEPVEIKSEPGKIRMLIKLNRHHDVYLLVGRLIDANIIDYINKTEGAAADYIKIKDKIGVLQIQFSAIFILVAILLLIAAIASGLFISGQISRPLGSLVAATERVKSGDWSVRVQEGPDDDEIGVLSLAFNRMVSQLKQQRQDLVIAQRSAAWADVARRVAHEIKNPLTPMSLAAGRLESKFGEEVSDKETFEKYISTIQRQIVDIKNIITEFENFAKLPKPDFENIELVSLVEQAVFARSSISDEVAYKFTHGCQNLQFSCDTTQFNQLLTNLLKNSEEALESKSGDKEIKVALQHSPDQVVIIVQDNGPGFPDNFIEQATQAYFTTRTKGTGLGLAIAKKITEDHYGQLELSNNIAGGANIKLTFFLRNLNRNAK